MAPQTGGRVVFIGNIPYGVSEEQITDTFARVGQVNNFRLVYDKETGRPKGFGFLEFADPDAAASAVRNLNDFDIMGRKLRVDWSNDSGGGGSDSAPTQQQQQAPSATNGDVSALPPLPPGTETPGLSAPDAISQTLSAMPAPQLLDLISQMKGMVTENPAQVTQLFAVAPQLAYAIFQALLLLGLVDTSVLGSIVQAATPQAQPYQQAPPQAQYAPPPQAYPAQPAQPAYLPFQAHAPTPPVQHTPYQPPPQPQAPPPQNQEALIRQVLAMTFDQVNALPPDARQQIIQLRAQLGAPVM